MKYWSRVSGNRWLVAKMFGVLMVRVFNSDFPKTLTVGSDFLPLMGTYRRIKQSIQAFLLHLRRRRKVCHVLKREHRKRFV